MAELVVREIAELQEVDRGNLPTLNTEEERFFSIAKAGDATALARFLTEQSSVNVNCLNDAGKYLHATW